MRVRSDLRMYASVLICEAVMLVVLWALNRSFS
jgi:hypothetical protein